MGALRQRHFTWLSGAVSVLLIAAVFAVYWPVLHYEFVNFDDLGYIIQNRHIQHGFNLHDLKWAFTSFYAGNWHPITWLSHTLDWQLFQLRSGGHHFTNVLLHAANTVLLFWFLLEAMRSCETPNTKHQTPSAFVESTSADKKKLRTSSRPEGGTVASDESATCSEPGMVSGLPPATQINYQPSTINHQPFWSTAFAAALFGLHPMHVESVAWIAERKDVLSTFLFLLTIWAYAKYVASVRHQGDNFEVRTPRLRRTSARQAKLETNSKSELKAVETAKYAKHAKGEYPKSEALTRSVMRSLRSFASNRFGPWYLVSLGLFALGLMSKPMLVTTPFVLLLLDYWPLRRFRASNIHNQLSALLFEKAPFFALSAADCVLTYMAQSHTGAVASSIAAPLDTRISNSILSYCAYLAKFFWPGKMAVYYPLREHAALWPVSIAAAILVIITIIVVVWWDRRPYLAFGWFWFIGTLVPVIGLVQVGLQGMADRYTYIPYIGLSIAIIWLLRDLALRARQSQSGLLKCATRPAVIGAFGAIALGACALGASHQVHYWQTSETLWRHTVDVTSGNAVARQNLGSALTEQRRFAEAARQFEEALKVAPMYAEAESNFGFALFMLGRNDEAVVHYERALAMKPIGRTHYLLAKVLMAEGKTADAVAEYKRAVELEPELPPALNDLAWLLAANPDPALRNGPEAVRYAEQACRASLSPNPLFIGTLAAAYAEAGRFPEAIFTAERAKALALQQGNTAIADKNEELLQLYRAGKAYHESPQNVK